MIGNALRRLPLLRILAASLFAFSLGACAPRSDGGSGGGDDGATPPADDGGETPPVDGGDETPPADDGGETPPADTSPVLPHEPPGALLRLAPDDRGTARFNGATGVTDPSVVSPMMRFPVERGPAFANSQIFMYGGGGYDYDGAGEVYPNPKGGQENDPRNFNYPWRDNFCEVRGHTLGLCAAGVGHQGQDIRPATCENGAFFAVVPEDGYIRRIGDTHLIEIYGDSGLVYKFLHVDRPLAPGIVKNARVTRGQRIGRISNKTGATARETSVHLHFEIWHGTASGGVNTGAGPLPPYTSLVESYLDLIADHPEHFDPVPPPADVHDCLAP